MLLNHTQDLEKAVNLGNTILDSTKNIRVKNELFAIERREIKTTVSFIKKILDSN